MQRFSTWRPVLLLAAFVVGGLGAPGLHHLDHASVRDQRYEADVRLREAAERLPAPVAEAGFFHEEVPSYHDLVCHFCLQLFAGTPLQAPDVAVVLDRESPPPVPSIVEPAHLGRLLPIRAPPSVA